MPTQRLSMRRIREVLRLRHQGLTERVIGYGPGTKSGPAAYRSVPVAPGTASVTTPDGLSSPTGWGRFFGPYFAVAQRLALAGRIHQVGI